jgi:uncharacterized protein (DUF362 family)
MGQLYDDFEQELAGFQQRYRDRPDRELGRLLLLALEREQLVTVAYSARLMSSRLDSLRLPPDIRRIFGQALAWAWKDEQMHAVYTRGLLLKRGTALGRFRALLQQLAGAIGGWASSVRQHRRWLASPLSVSLASVVTRMGNLTGRVPRAIKRELQFLPLRSFCLLQVDAERTAAACWKRLVEVVERFPHTADERTRREFERMWRDEERHEKIFALIASSLDETDRVRAEITAESLARRIAEVDPFFLPREHREPSLREHPLGQGGPVWVAEGSEEDSKADVFRRLLDDAALSKRISERARALGKSAAELRVVIKATFMLGYDRRDKAILIDPALLEELGRCLKEAGCREVLVGEGRNLYDRFYEGRGVREVAQYFGLESPFYRVVDLTEEQVPHHYSRGMAQDTVARSWRDADFRILFAKLRSHPTDFSHLTIGGTQGVGARLEEFLFFERQAHRDTAILMPLAEFPPHFGLIDGYDSAADGLVGIIACPNPPRPRRLYASGDALAVDLVATRHMGLSDPRQSYFLGAACQWFGDPTERIEVMGPDEPLPGWRHPYYSGASTLLSLLAYPAYQFAFGRGAGFIPPMDPKAFPPKARAGWWLEAQRWFIRRLLGIGSLR